MRNHRSVVTALVFSIVVVGFVFGASTAFAQTPAAKTPQKPTAAEPMHKAMEKPASSTAKEVTLRGEVVDLCCYMQDPSKAQGPEHAECIRQGFPVGYVSNGQLYLLLGKGQDPAKELIAKMVGVKSELTGKLYEHNGVKAVDLVKIEKTAG
jgi:hypothetical protein